MTYTISKFLAAYEAATTQAQKQAEFSHFYEEMKQFDYFFGHICLTKGREVLCLLRTGDANNLYIDLTSGNRFGEYEDIDTAIFIWEKQDQKNTMETLITNFLKNYKEAKGPIERNLRAFTFTMEAMDKFGFVVMAISFVENRHVMMLSNDDMDSHYFLDFDSGHFGKYESLGDALNNWNARDKFPIGKEVEISWPFGPSQRKKTAIKGYSNSLFITAQDIFVAEDGLFELKVDESSLKLGDKVSAIWKEESSSGSMIYRGETATTFILETSQGNKRCYLKESIKLEKWPDHLQ